MPELEQDYPSLDSDVMMINSDREKVEEGLIDVRTLKGFLV